MSASTHEAARLAGITYRQASYWCEAGVFGPHLAGRGSGRHRHFAPGDVAALAAVAVFARFNHGLNDDKKNGAAGVLTVGPAIAHAVRQRLDAVWLVIDPDRTVTAHVQLVDAVRAVTLRGGASPRPDHHDRRGGRMSRGGSDVYIVSPTLDGSWGWTCDCGTQLGSCSRQGSYSTRRLAAIDSAARHGAQHHPGQWQLGADVIIRQPTKQL